jgi:hypothetical protein
MILLEIRMCLLQIHMHLLDIQMLVTEDAGVFFKD